MASINSCFFIIKSHQSAEIRRLSFFVVAGGFIRKSWQIKRDFHASLWAKPDQNAVCLWQLYEKATSKATSAESPPRWAIGTGSKWALPVTF